MKKGIVYLPGVFDLFHVGHLNAIIQAKRYGETLVVGVQEDGSVYKQKRRYPVVPQHERIRILKHIKEVSDVIPYHSTYQAPVLRHIKPDLLAVNEEYGTKDKNQKKTLSYALKHGIRIARIAYTHGISTTELRRHIVKIDYNLAREFWNQRASLHKKGLKAVNLGTTPEQSAKQIELLFKYLEPRDRNFVDLGCGLGRIAIPLARKVQKVIAVDFSEKILEILRQTLRKEKIHNLRTVCATSYAKLPLPYGQFDGVLIFGILIHLNDPEFQKTIENTRRLLKPSGKVFVRESVGTHGHFEVDKFSEELQTHYKGIYRTPGAIESCFKRAGFKVAVSRKLYQQRKETGTWFWVFQKKALP